MGACSDADTTWPPQTLEVADLQCMRLQAHWALYFLNQCSLEPRAWYIGW